MRKVVYILLKTSYVFNIVPLCIILSPWIVSSNNIFPYQFSVTLYITLLSSFFLVFKYRLRRNTICHVCKNDLVLLFCFLYFFLRIKFENSNPENFYKLISYGCLYVYFRSFTSKELWLAISIIPFIGIVQFVYSINSQADYYNWSEKLTRIYGSFFNTSIWGGFFAIILLISICCILSRQHSKWYKVIHFILIMLWVIVIWYSNARAAWLTVLGGMSWLLIFYRNRFDRYLIGYILCFLLFFLPLIYVLYTFKQPSSDGRLLIWNVGMKMWADRPFWGWGIGNFCNSFMNYQASFLATMPIGYQYLADETRYAFNEYLQVGIEQGGIGIILLGGVVVLTFIHKQREKHSLFERYIIMNSSCFFVAIAIWSCFSYPLQINQILVIFILYLAAYNTVFDNWIIFKFYFRKPYYYLLYIFFIVCDYKCFVYHRNCDKWHTTLLMPNLEESHLCMRNLYPLLKDTPYFSYSYGVMLNDISSKQAIPILQEANEKYASYYTLIELGKAFAIQNDIKQAEKTWMQAASMIPCRFMPYYEQMKMYMNHGDINKAQEVARYILNKRSKVNSAKLYEIYDTARWVLSEIK